MDRSNVSYFFTHCSVSLTLNGFRTRNVKARPVCFQGILYICENFDIPLVTSETMCAFVAVLQCTCLKVLLFIFCYSVDVLDFRLDFLARFLFWSLLDISDCLLCLCVNMFTGI